MAKNKTHEMKEKTEAARKAGQGVWRLAENADITQIMRSIRLIAKLFGPLGRIVMDTIYTIIGIIGAAIVVLPIAIIIITVLVVTSVMAEEEANACNPNPTQVVSGSGEAAAPGELPGETVAKYAFNAGFRGQDLVIAVAIAKAESSWNPTLTYQNTDSHRSVDKGLFQMNDYWNKDAFALGDWRDPQINAHMAKKAFDGRKAYDTNGWKDWTTYNKGRYLVHVPKAVTAVNTFYASDPNAQAAANAVTASTKGAGAAAAVGGADAAAVCSGGGQGTITPASGNIVTVKAGGASIQVDSSIANNVKALLEAAAADGVPLKGGGYRDPQGQINTRRRNCGSSNYAIYEAPSRYCSPPTARPGTSMHEKGQAIDFENCSSTATACNRWLKQNAGKFGLINWPVEPWHWSTNGK
jgi:hypothetical protein